MSKQSKVHIQKTGSTIHRLWHSRTLKCYILGFVDSNQVLLSSKFFKQHFLE
eukprot:c51580_g1_i1 orf=108-263(+)